MFGTIYKSLVRVWQIVSHRSQLQLVLALLIVFPLLFTFMAQQFLSVATNQIDFGLKQTISHDHDTIAALLTSELKPEQMNQLLTMFITEDSLVRTFQVARDEGLGIKVMAASSPGVAGSIVSDDSWYKSAIAHSGSSVIYPFLRNGERVWLAYRAVNVDGVQWYIHSETNLAAIDAQLQHQTNRAYLTLAFIFLFLGIIIWWLWRQYDYKEAWEKSENKLQEQFGFTNMMVHELRAPLTAIRGYASLIAESNTLPPEQEQHLERISTSTVRLVRLVNDFLEVARIQAGTLTVSLKEGDIRETIKTVVEEMTLAAEAKQLKLNCTMPMSPVIIATDIARLHQIVTNLLSNAIKYTNQGSINVVVNQNPREVEIRIQDSGDGISAKDQTQLFQPFKRVGKADEGREVGSGLGMWITKKLVVLLGGEVTIESIEKVGTHAVVHLYYQQKSK